MSTFWKVEEAVSAALFIVWDGTYTTREGADAAILRAKAGPWCRAVLYRTGTGNGPVRVES